MYCNRSDQDQKRDLSRIFSALLFCLSLVPSTSDLAIYGYVYKILNTIAPISNLLYMNSLKKYCRNKQEQVGELK